MLFLKSWTWTYRLSQSWSCNHALTSENISCWCSCNLQLSWSQILFHFFYWKGCNIWGHNRLCITPGAHSSLASLIYVSLISARGLVQTASVNVASGWPGYRRALWSTAGSRRLLRNCENGVVPCVYILLIHPVAWEPSPWARLGLQFSISSN